jgi:predicted nucleic acid-binding protein
MRILLDINVLLDVILERRPWDLPAAHVLAAVERGQVTGFVAGHTLPTVHYVVSKVQDRTTAAAAITDVLRIVEVIPVEKADFHQALVLPLDDFEDAVQLAAALKVGVDYIVTRNETDFRKGSLRAIHPETLLPLL